MNAESTPVRENLIKSLWDDEYLDITPIKQNNRHQINSWVCQNLDKNDLNFIKEDPKPVKSPETHKRKKLSEVNSFHTKKFASDNKILENVFMNESDDIFLGCGCSDEYLDNLVNNKLESSHNVSDIDNEKDSKMKYEGPHSEITDNKSFKIQTSQAPHISKSKCIVNESFCNKSSLRNVEELSKNTGLCSSIDEIKQVLSDSDVMKWSDESMFSQGKKHNFSDQIKRKLLENAKNNEIVKSQTSGWTQFNFSKLLNGSISNSKFHEIGPYYGLPAKVQKIYEEQKGIKELYSWQQDCLNLEAVKLHKNLVYALPTSGGKTLVAELLILKEILCYKKNVLFVLPFVSIVQEKMRDFSQLAIELEFLVEEYAAGKGIIPPKKRRRKNSIFIATIEKALVLLNSLIENKRLEEIGLIVVDELHLLSEEGRGPVLESLLTQILFINGKIQIVGMTATIGNLEEIATFLRAESFTGNFRPVCLTEYIKCQNKIYKIDWASKDHLKEIRTLNSPLPGVDPDGICELVKERVPKDSVLVFCPTKKNCENVAMLLSRLLLRDLTIHKEEEKKSLIRALLSETNDQICPILEKTIPFGVAYHHSGLTAGERKLLEESFRDGTLSVICCTSTLAAGVNLPARRVILRAPYVGKDFISLTKYKQMIGRAGRTGFGGEGESYLICQPMDLEKVDQLLKSKMDETVSQMDSENCKDLLLSAIGLGIATTRKTLKELISCSLLHFQAKKLNKDSIKMTDACISCLYKQGALKIKCDKEIPDDSLNSKLELNSTQFKNSVKITNNSPLCVSRLGRAAMKGGMTLEKAHELYSDLTKAQGSLVLLTSLHLLYLVTPYDSLTQIKPNYSIYFNVYMQLDSKEVHTAKVIGITEYIMSRLAVGMKPKNIQETVLNRFYVSLILNELWKQQTIWDVAMLFQLPRGIIQSLMMSASTFASSVLRFCEELEELWSFKSLLTEFAPRLAHCCSAELLPLMDLPAVKRGRAKQLYDAGFKSISTLASAKPSDLVRSVDHMSNKVASQIIAAAKLLLLEKAENLREEADEVLKDLADKSFPTES